MDGLPTIEESCDLLVVRGAFSTDDLTPLGLPFAERYQRAGTVVLVPNNGPARVVKGESVTVSFVDIDSRLRGAASALERISDAYQEAHPDSAHLAHAYVGLFIFFGHVERGAYPIRMLDLLAEGDVGLFKQCAERFIADDFSPGFARIGVNGDEPSPAATGRGVDCAASSEASADLQANAVAVDAGGGQDSHGDSR